VQVLTSGLMVLGAAPQRQAMQIGYGVYARLAFVARRRQRLCSTQGGTQRPRPVRGTDVHRVSKEEEAMHRLEHVGSKLHVLLGGAALAAALAAVPFGAAAQSADQYPSRPVKMLVPYGPGGATDIIARHLATKLTESLGQSFVVENRPGASGNLALEAVAKAPADGYTLLVGNVSTNTINESTFSHTLKIKPSRDLIAITKLVEIPHVLIATSSFPVGSVSEAIAQAKKAPGKVNYASAGLGSYPHLDMLKLSKAAGVEMTHIPYKGGAGQMITALLSAEVQLSFINLASTLEHVKSGRLKPIATTAPVRLAELPNVPTMAEQGYAGVGTNAWQALFAPAGTPKPVVDKLFNSIVAVLSKPEMKEMLAKQMMTVDLSKSPDDFAALVRKETREWGDFVAANKVKID
jgi:tripartite-type tricarboxylate transporter receptor subunit TctC